MIPKILEGCSLAVVLLSLFLGNGCSGDASKKPQNTTENPPVGFTGIWTVFSRETGQKWIEAQYVDGKKHGTERRWYVDSGEPMSQQTFTNGVLNGQATKWSNWSEGKTVLCEGVFRMGRAWDGTFMESGFRPNPSPQVRVMNVLPTIQRFQQGKLVARFEWGKEDMPLSLDGIDALLSSPPYSAQTNTPSPLSND